MNEKRKKEKKKKKKKKKEKKTNVCNAKYNESRWNGGLQSEWYKEKTGKGWDTEEKVNIK